MYPIEITNKAGKVSLSETVSPLSINRMIEEISKLFGAKAALAGLVTGAITAAAKNGVDTLEININSPGGSVMDGYRMYGAIKALRARGVYVTATINTLAASMASIVAMAADKVQIVTGGRMMIHEPSQAISGGSADHERAAKLLNDIASEMAEIYAAKTKRPTSEMRELMRKETWMGASEAKRLGFVDEVIDFATATATAQSMPNNTIPTATSIVAPPAVTGTITAASFAQTRPLMLKSEWDKLSAADKSRFFSEAKGHLIDDPKPEKPHQDERGNLTRAGLSGLSNAQRNEYFAKGGKLAD